MRTIKGMMGLAVGLLLAACGGGSDVCFVGPDNSACNTAGAITANALTIQLSATSVSNSGPGTLTATATAATDGGQTVTGVPVSFRVDSGATYTPSATETDAAGIVTATVNIGTDKSSRTITVVASSGSLSATAVFAVTGATLSSTASPAVVPPSSTGNKVLFVLKDAVGSAMVGQAISVTAGTAGFADGTTDSNGEFTFTYNAPAAPGALSVVANAGGVERVQDVLVQATISVPAAIGTPTSATVAANPSVVAPNLDVSTNNRTEVRALFINASNRPISNMRVRFYVNDYGTFSTGSNPVYSDANGRAITGFVPGARTSPKDGVTITACYSNLDFSRCSDTGVVVITTTLTIAADPLSISIGTDGLLINNDLTYSQRFVVTAVDIAGRAKANVEITPSIDLQTYYKGQYTRSAGKWVSVCENLDPAVCPIYLPRPGYAGCPNEDIDRTGFYQALQDTNLNGQIDPRKSDVVISPVSTKTDAAGKAVLQIEYPKNLAGWIEYRILVSAGVNGTEGRASWVDVTGVPVAAISAEGAPAFIRSPYGVVIDDAIPSAASLYGRDPFQSVPPCANAD